MHAARKYHKDSIVHNEFISLELDSLDDVLLWLFVSHGLFKGWGQIVSFRSLPRLELPTWNIQHHHIIMKLGELWSAQGGWEWFKVVKCKITTSPQHSSPSKIVLYKETNLLILACFYVIIFHGWSSFLVNEKFRAPSYTLWAYNF